MSCSREIEDVAYLLFRNADVGNLKVAERLSPTPLTPSERAAFGLVDWVVRVASPRPAMGHCEWVLLDSTGMDAHFATYCGESPGFQPPGPFYTHEEVDAWRAVPVHFGSGTAAAVRHAMADTVEPPLRPVRRTRRHPEPLGLLGVRPVGRVRIHQVQVEEEAQGRVPVHPLERPRDDLV